MASEVTEVLVPRGGGHMQARVEKTRTQGTL
jgi:hypothetical protein